MLNGEVFGDDDGEEDDSLEEAFTPMGVMVNKPDTADRAKGGMDQGIQIINCCITDNNIWTCICQPLHFLFKNVWSIHSNLL